MRTTTVLIMGLLLVSGCGLYSVDGHFGVDNHSDHSIQLVIAHKKAGPVIPPNSSATFNADVPMPSTQGGTDPLYKLTSVDISVYDATLGTLVESTANCMAGENTLTSVSYQIYAGGYPQVSCHNSYNRKPVKRDTLAMQDAGAKL